MNIIEQVRKKTPLIHHLTNQVAMNFTANGLLAFGGSPIMAKESQEVEEIVGIADGVLINIGTIVESDLEAMVAAGKAANNKNIPVVLDPVGVAATTFRQAAAKKLLHEIDFTLIKGNAGEMAKLVGISWRSKGVESIDDNTNQLALVTDLVANTFNTIAVVTGEIDIISNGVHQKSNTTGHPYLTKITGAGCLLGSIITACLTAKQDPFIAAFEAVSFYGKAAENAAQNANGTGSFYVNFLDELGKD